MRYMRKIRFGCTEITDILVEMGEYMWVAVDVKRGVMVAGDELMTHLKWDLLAVGCNIRDIYGIGLDLVTGEIDYYSYINAKMAFPGSTKEVPMEQRAQVEALVRYFFEELPVFKRCRQGRYVRYGEVSV